MGSENEITRERVHPRRALLDASWNETVWGDQERQARVATPPCTGQPHEHHSFLPPSGQRDRQPCPSLWLIIAKSVAYTFQRFILWQKEGFIPIKGSFALIKSHFSGLIFLWKHPRSLSPPQSIPVLSNAAQPQRTSSSLALLVQPLERQWHTGHSCWPQGHHHPQGGGKFLPCPEFPGFLSN